MVNEKTVSAVVLAAGSSTRFKGNQNKILIEINNKPIFQYSIEAFANNKKIDEIILVFSNAQKQEIQKIIEKVDIKKPIKLVEGGNLRSDSVYNAITNTNLDIVIIHDSARPLIKQSYIDNCLDAMDKYDGCTIAVKSKDTIKISNDEDCVVNTTNRKNTWVIQTPQCFIRKTLLEGFDNVKQLDGITDDCMLIEKLGKDVKLIEGDYENIKLTTAEDLDILKLFI